METDWCWICRREHPMLDDQEFAAVWTCYQELERSRYVSVGFQGSPREIIEELNRQRELTPIQESGPRPSHFQPLQEAYEKVTGLKFDGDEPKMILHYRISYYGPPCPYCGRLLRNKRAKQCFVCGMDWHDAEHPVSHRNAAQS
jgi:hypothetical protein